MNGGKRRIQPLLAQSGGHGARDAMLPEDRRHTILDGVLYSLLVVFHQVYGLHLFRREVSKFGSFFAEAQFAANDLRFETEGYRLYAVAVSVFDY